MRQGSARSPKAWFAHGIVGRTTPRSGMTTARSSASTGCRSSTSTHSHQPLRWGPPDKPDRYALVFNGEIYNYLELRAELATDDTARLPHRGRRRGDRRGATTTGAPTASRGCAACSRSRSGTPRPASCSARATRSASSRCSWPTGRRHRVRQREEEPAGAADRAGRRRIDTAPCSTTRCCSTCRSRRPCTAASRRLESGSYAHAAPGGAPTATRYFTPAVRTAEAVSAPAAEAGSLRRDHRGARGLGRQAHARRRHRRLVPVRRHRLDGDRRAGHAAQPEPDHLHHRLRARGLLRGRRGGRVGRGDRRPAHVEGGQSRPSSSRDAARDRLVPRRSGRRPGAGAAVLRRPRGPQARQGGAVRRGRRRAVRRLHDLPGTVVAAAVRRTARPAAQGSAAVSRAAAARACAARACCTAAR